MGISPVVAAGLLALSVSACAAPDFEWTSSSPREPVDYGAAAVELRPLAEKGDPRAQHELGLMYERGQGVRQDFVLAYKWLNLAAAALPPGEARDRAARQRDDLARRMTAAQVAQAQDMARDFKPPKESAAPAQAGNPPLAQALNPRPAQLPNPPPAPPADLVRDIQRYLAALGRHGGPKDGVPGARTRAAIRAYQRDKGLTVDGEATPALRAWLQAEAEIAAEPVAAPSNRELVNSGSGFAINRYGHVLTSNHVVEGCAEITAKPAGGKSIRAETIARDQANDLALIKVAAASATAAFRFDQPMRAGDSIVAVGYPLPSLLASEAKISTGTVSALAGMHNDARHLQIAAPIQRGNSGGPLLDSKGHVTGIVVSKLDALKVAGAMGDLPQNVSFAVKAAVARAFLDGAGAAYDTAGPGRELKPAEIGEKAKSFTLRIECWR